MISRLEVNMRDMDQISLIRSAKGKGIAICPQGFGINARFSNVFSPSRRPPITKLGAPFQLDVFQISAYANDYEHYSHRNDSARRGTRLGLGSPHWR